MRLTLAGVALAAVLEGLSNGIALLNPDVYDQLRFWQAGSLDIRTLQTLKIVPVSYTHLDVYKRQILPPATASTAAR